MNDIFELLGKVVVVGGGGALIVFQIFKHLAARWLDDRFKKSFQQLVHDQNKEVERLKADLTRSFDRASKLHVREFEVLPKIWEQVTEAFWQVGALVSPMQQFSDLDRMPPEVVAEVLAASELTEWQKKEVLASDKKTKAFGEFLYWHRLWKARVATREADVTLVHLGIFVPDPIKGKLGAVLDLCRGALVEDEINHAHPPQKYTDRLRKDCDRLSSEGKTLMDDAESLIKKRLWEN
jgi:hypothetical protein